MNGPDISRAAARVMSMNEALHDDDAAAVFIAAVGGAHSLDDVPAEWHSWLLLGHERWRAEQPPN